VWISDDDGGVERLWHGVDGTFEAVASPVSDPRGLWGTGPTDVWLAGGDGLAHWDGAAWSRVEGVDGALTEVLGRDGEVWAAGVSGVWRVTR
jgi:hypothetical protein